jgi:hypothetical protein
MANALLRDNQELQFRQLWKYLNQYSSAGLEFIMNENDAAWELWSDNLILFVVLRALLFERCILVCVESNLYSTHQRNNKRRLN